MFEWFGKRRREKAVQDQLLTNDYVQTVADKIAEQSGTLRPTPLEDAYYVMRLAVEGSLLISPLGVYEKHGSLWWKLPADGNGGYRQDEVVAKVGTVGWYIT